MKDIIVLLKKEFLKINYFIMPLICMSIAFPLFLYLFFSIPLSIVFIDMAPIYINWSLGGILLVSVFFIIYTLSYIIFKDNLKIEFIKSVPINNYALFFSNYIFSLLIGLLQTIVTLILITSLNNDNINFISFIFLLVIIIPSILIIANISFFVNLIKNQFILNYIHIIFFIFISFALGSFFPLEYFPKQYVNIIQYMPLCGTIINVQQIISSENIYFSLFLVSIIYSISFTFLAIKTYDFKNKT